MSSNLRSTRRESGVLFPGSADGRRAYAGQPAARFGCREFPPSGARSYQDLGRRSAPAWVLGRRHSAGDVRRRGLSGRIDPEHAQSRVCGLATPAACRKSTSDITSRVRSSFRISTRSCSATRARTWAICWRSTSSACFSDSPANTVSAGRGELQSRVQQHGRKDRSHPAVFGRVVARLGRAE